MVARLVATAGPIGIRRLARPDYAANRYDTQLIVHDIATGESACSSPGGPG